MDNLFVLCTDVAIHVSKAVKYAKRNPVSVEWIYYLKAVAEIIITDNQSQ